MIKDMAFDRKKNVFTNNKDNVNNKEFDLVGTAEYIAPEVLEGKSVDFGVDLWALGCIIYLFLHGKTPFKDKANLLIFDNVLNKSPMFKDVSIFANCF
jgi:serine/threonine protein kinase